MTDVWISGSPRQSHNRFHVTPDCPELKGYEHDPRPKPIRSLFNDAKACQTCARAEG